MIDMRQIQFFDSEAQAYLENLIIYGFQRTAVSSTINPYEGLKRFGKLLSVLLLGVSSTINPYEGLKLYAKSKM